MQRSDTSRILGFILLGVGLLPTFVVGQSSPTANPYDSELRALEQQMQSAKPAHAAVLLHRGYMLREYVDDRGELSRWLGAVTADPQQHPLVRDEAQRWLALIDLHTGKLDSARSRYDSLGFVRQWSIIGPFPAVGLDSTLGPEGSFHPAQSYPNADGHTRRWKPQPALGPQPWIDLVDYYSRPVPATAFAATSLYSEQRRVVALRFSSDSPVAVWVNGSKAFTRTEPSVLAFDQQAVAVELRPGWNTVVLKLCRGSEDAWRFGLRITDPHGSGLQLQASAAHEGLESTTPSVSLPSPDDLVQMAKRAAEPTPSADAYETLADIERQHAQGPALTAMRRAVALHANARRWTAIAEMAAQADERFAALNRALRADPSYVPAYVALADYYSQRRQLEKARDLLQRAAGLAPADFVVRKRLADLYVAAGVNSEAISVYNRLEEQFPRPLWLKRELAKRWEDFGLFDRARTLVRAALRENFDGPEERGLLERIAEKQHDLATLRASFQERLQLSPTDTSAMAELAQSEAGTGDFATAEKTLRAALALDSDSDDLHRRLAEVLARDRQPAESKQEFEAALNLNPRLENVRRRLQTDNDANDPEQRYLVNAAELAAAARRGGVRESGDAVLLANVRVQRVYENGLDSVRTQQVTYIATDQSARNYTFSRMQFSPGAEQLRVLRARVYKADGRVIEGEQAGDSAVSDAAVSMYYDVRSHAVRFPGLQKGDVVEIDYRVTPTISANPYGDYFGEVMAFRTDVVQRLQRYVLITPADRKFYIHEARMPAPAEVATVGRERVYRWEAHDTAALANEPRGPAITEVAPYVHVSSFASWDELGRRYAQLIAPQFELDANLRDALDRLLQGKRTDLEKIRAIHGFVLRNTHYVGLEFGIYSYKPYPVSQTYARRFGDCKDKASLMIALLRASGIDADIALVRTRRLGAIGDSPASVAVFNHAIAYVPRYDLWLDGTAEYAGPRELPIDDQGAMALTVAADGQSKLRNIPVSSADDNYTERVIDAQLGSDGVIRFSGTASTRGEDAPGLRRDFEVTERQRDSVRERLAEVFPTVHIDDVSVEGAHDLDSDVTVEFRGALDTFAGHRTLSLAASWMPRGYVERLAPLATRTQDLLLPAAWTTDEELRFSLPQGASVASVPQDSKVETSFGWAALHFEQRPGQLIVHTQVQFRSTRLTPQQYPEFRAFCGEIEQLFRSEAKVVLP